MPSSTSSVNFNITREADPFNVEIRNITDIADARPRQACRRRDGGQVQDRRRSRPDDAAHRPWRQIGEIASRLAVTTGSDEYRERSSTT